MIRKNTFYPEIVLDKTSAEPLHLQLGREIRLQIRQHRPECGVRLLSERKLAELHKLDRSTVHRAYIELIKDGVIEQNPPKKGFFITSEAHSKLKKPFPAIGVVIPDKFSDYINQKRQIRLSYLNGIIDHAAKFECSIMMIQLPDANKSRELVEDWIKHVVDRLDGIIHLGDRGLESDLPLEMLLDYDSIPQVLISAFSDREHIGSIVGDPSVGALALAEYFCEYGHQNIGIASCYPKHKEPTGRLFEYEAARRQAEVVNSFEKCKLNIMPEWNLWECDDEPVIEEKLRKIYSMPNAPTAFWCLNDNVALMVANALNNIGLSVPEDVSIVGYDDLLPESEGMPLTTIKIPFYSIGCRAVDLLIQYHENNVDSTNQIIRLPTSLVVKNSVARPNNKIKNLWRQSENKNIKQESWKILNLTTN